MNQTNQKHIEGEYVVGKVEKSLSYGIFVCLDDGSRAYIRRRELTLSGNIDPREVWQEGDRVEGVVIKSMGAGYSLELSRRATLPEPWNEFVKEFHQGDVVKGIIKSLMAYGAFVEVRPGVDGLIPLKELAAWEIQKPEDIVWIGDMVEGLITHLDYRNKKLRMSIRARMRQLEVVAGIIKDIGLFSQQDSTGDETGIFDTIVSRIDAVQMNLQTKSDIEAAILARVGRILVIDDDEVIRLPLVQWLQHQGYEVDEANTVEEAHKKVIKEAYGLLFVVINLLELDELAFLRQIRQQGFKSHIAIMSTTEYLVERSCDIEAIGVVEAFVKPLHLDEIEYMLYKIGRGETLSPWQMEFHPAEDKTPKSFQQITKAINTPVSLSDKFQAGLRELLATTPAEVGLIFRLDPISRTVSISTRSGNPKLNEEAIHTLQASPVRDVIEEGEQILENRMTGHNRERFRKLLDLLPFESCIGIPIEGNGKTHRAVFLLHSAPHAFSRYHLGNVVAASTLFAVAIERQLLEEQTRSINKLLLTGQLAGGLSHEVYNKMSGLEIQLRNLQMDCRITDDRLDKSIHIAELERAINKLYLTFNDLKDAVELFQHLAQAGEEYEMYVNTLILKTVSLLRPIMHKHKVKVEFDLSHDMPATIGSPIRLQQAFANIMLNAIQHMASKPGNYKMLTITTSFQSQTKERPIKIHFSDTGWGIHRRLWKKIFDLGYTTRPGGTGQGLYIARSLVESLGGKILVEQSMPPIGSTFLIELPAAP